MRRRIRFQSERPETLAEAADAAIAGDAFPIGPERLGRLERRISRVTRLQRVEVYVSDALSGLPVPTRRWRRR